VIKLNLGSRKGCDDAKKVKNSEMLEDMQNVVNTYCVFQRTIPINFSIMNKNPSGT